MGGKELVRSDHINVTLSTAVRNTSCSHGWLRLLVQSIFCIVTVASFILIVMMAYQRSHSTDSNVLRNGGSRCVVSNCKIVCSQAPYFDEYEEDIVYALSDAESYYCQTVSLMLSRPIFMNESLPLYWLSGVRANIQELAIVGGNLKHIPSEAFITSFTRHVRYLILEEVTITTWDQNTLIGLTRLENLFIEDCTILDVQRNALRSVDETLNTLTIRSSGQWNPVNITGSSDLKRLTTVDFGSNNFDNILERRTFSRLRFCKVLYLNSCKLTAIAAGAFDFLDSIEVIYLNNNYLVTIPPGLFDRITAVVNPQPRIDLQDNFWHCNCSSRDLRMLFKESILIVDPVCYYPEDIHGKYFSEFDTNCENYFNTSSNVIIVNESEEDYRNSISYEDHSDFLYLNGRCYYGNVSRVTTPKLISPTPQYKCIGSRIQNTDYTYLIQPNFSYTPNNYSWIRPTFFIQTSEFSVVEVSTSGIEGYGLLWYQSTCPNEIYCIQTLPKFLRVYDVDITAWYTFCPMDINSGMIIIDKCIGYSLANINHRASVLDFTRILLLCVATSSVCLVFGAVCVYALIRKKPTLLRGSKRVLFVKHKTVDALVLPPKVPLRDNVQCNKSDFSDNKVLFVPAHKNSMPEKFMRSNSMRSNKSNTPSYISALQPTEDQLAEWRLKHHFDNHSLVTSDLSVISWIYDGDSIYYSVNQDTDRMYESLK